MSQKIFLLLTTFLFHIAVAKHSNPQNEFMKRFDIAQGHIHLRWNKNGSEGIDEYKYDRVSDTHAGIRQSLFDDPSLAKCPNQEIRGRASGACPNYGKQYSLLLNDSLTYEGRRFDTLTEIHTGFLNAKTGMNIEIPFNKSGFGMHQLLEQSCPLAEQEQIFESNPHFNYEMCKRTVFRDPIVTFEKDEATGEKKGYDLHGLGNRDGVNFSSIFNSGQNKTHKSPGMKNSAIITNLFDCSIYAYCASACLEKSYNNECFSALPAIYNHATNECVIIGTHEQLRYTSCSKTLVDETQTKCFYTRKWIMSKDYTYVTSFTRPDYEEACPPRFPLNNTVFGEFHEESGKCKSLMQKKYKLLNQMSFHSCVEFLYMKTSADGYKGDERSEYWGLWVAASEINPASKHYTMGTCYFIPVKPTCVMHKENSFAFTALTANDLDLDQQIIYPIVEEYDPAVDGPNDDKTEGDKEAEQKAKQEAERKAKEEAERRAKEEEEQRAREEAERKAKEAEQKAREEAERKAKEEAERRAKEEAERRAKEEEERKAKEAEQKAREEAERRAKEEEERKAKEAEQKAREEAERRAKEEEERKATLLRKKRQEEQQRKEREERERQEAERQEAERKRQEAERKRQEAEEERKRLAEEAEKRRKQAEEAERQRQEEEKRRQEAEEERKRLAEEAEKQRQEEERKRKEAEEAEKQRQEEERKRLEAEEEERKRQEAEEAERQRQEEEERKRQEAEEAERQRQEEEKKRQEAEEAERQRQEEEKKRQEAEEERKRLAEEAERKRQEAEEAERKRQQAEKDRQEAERQRQEAENKRKQEEEELRKKQEAEELERKKQQDEAERQRQEAEKKRQEAERQRQEAEKQRKEEEKEEMKRLEEERKKLQEERAKEEAERKKLEEEKRKLDEQLAQKSAEKQNTEEQQKNLINDNKNIVSSENSSANDVNSKHEDHIIKPHVENVNNEEKTTPTDNNEKSNVNENDSEQNNSQLNATQNNDSSEDFFKKADPSEYPPANFPEVRNKIVEYSQEKICRKTNSSTYCNMKNTIFDTEVCTGEEGLYLCCTIADYCLKFFDYESNDFYNCTFKEFSTGNYKCFKKGKGVSLKRKG